MPQLKKQRQLLFIAAAIFIATLALYFPSRTFSWVNFDDNDYVVENIFVSRGLTWEGIFWAFTHFHCGYWIPLTWVSHMLDCQLWSLSPGPPHLANAAIHAANSMLLFLTLYVLTGARWRSALVAALFAWHPQHVEVVAWLAERKGVLSTFFWLAAILSYVRYTRSFATRWYLLALLFFAFGIMSKPMVVTLPCVLLLLDVWPLSRLKLENPLSSGARLVAEKIPFFILSAASATITIYGHSLQGALVGIGQLPLGERAGNAVLSYARYLQQMFWPADLIAFYPYVLTISLPAVTGISLVLVAISIVALWQIKSRPYLMVGWFWYLGTLFPVIGFFQAGGQAVADRFTYIPSIGIFLIFAWGVAELARKSKPLRNVVYVGCAMILMACLALSAEQMKQWQNETTLFTRILKIAGPVHVAYDHLGAVLYREGNLKGAMVNFRQALALKPEFPDAHNNLATVLFLSGEKGEAFVHFREAIKLNPKYARAYNNLGNALLESGKPDEAITQYQNALKLNANYISARLNYGIALRELGKVDESREQFEKVLQVAPDSSSARQALESLPER